MTEPAIALVVGASRGIGLAITRNLLGRKSVRRLYATYRDAGTGAQLLETRDDRLTTVMADVTREQDLSALADVLRANGDEPDLVVHAAGILHESGVQPEKSLSQCRPAALVRAFEVNSIGPLMLARAVVPLMPRRRPTQYAALSAMVGSIGDNRLGGWYGYRASKAALNQFLRTLAIECRRTHPGMCISAVHPGTTDTDLSRPFQGRVEPGKLYTTEQSAARILHVVCSGTPEESGRFMNWDGKRIPW